MTLSPLPAPAGKKHGRMAGFREMSKKNQTGEKA